ncbi:alkaline phosphatase family protein [Haloplanus rallus]|uniref:alkaline phosphatase family protein n=1 Tax=Haloplanus rallus TaxID=1816183 RepID=UPI001E418CCD|nr:alkaline phosphatase family protein [Haloplanus rallus]
MFGDWLDDLPTIAGILERGTGARMESVTPPVTSPAWRCYATGKQPSSIGVYWWRQFDRDRQEFVGVDQIPLTSKCYWEYLDDPDETVAVLGVPLNAPPREVNGVLVAGGPYADPEEYTYPASIQETLETEFDYQLHPSTDPASADHPERQEIVDDLEKMIHQRFDVAEWLREERSPALLNLTFFYVNHLQHMSWRSDGVKHLWQVIDERLGQLLTDTDDVVIHSDHGLHEIQRVFYLNAWLVENGYLSTHEESTSKRQTVGRVIDTVNDALERAGAKSLVVRSLPDSVVDRLGEYGSDRIIDTSDFERRIDFERSAAVGLPHGVVYVLNDDEATTERLREELARARDPETGMEIANDVVDAAEVYPTPLPDDAPDLFVRYADGIEVKDVNADDESRVFGSRAKFRADNHLEGVLMAAGPSITGDEAALDRPGLVDIAPTALHLLGEPIPEDVDGDVLTDLFASGSDPCERPVESQSPGRFEATAADVADHEETKERLQDLGYLE